MCIKISFHRHFNAKNNPKGGNDYNEILKEMKVSVQ